MTIQEKLSIIKLNTFRKNKINANTPRFEEAGLQACNNHNLQKSVKLRPVLKPVKPVD